MIFKGLKENSGWMMAEYSCPFKQYFEEHGEHVFDNYMNSIEIKAYCRDTERRTVEKLSGGERG